MINVTSLSKSFNGKPAVIDVSLRVAAGEIFGFLGPNGSGKTTTIRMLCGLLTPDTGQGTCLGYDILTESYAIKIHVGYMTQKFSLYEDLTVRENLEFIARLYNVPKYKSVVDQSIEELGLIKRQNQLARTLSGGWKQRLALSAALIHQPQLLLLDEPTAGVDPKARREFWTHLQKLANLGVTTLVSTHYMDEAVRCNKLAYIFSGKILTQGTAEQIIANSGIHTYEITGEGNLNVLAKELAVLQGIDQLSTLGDKIRISGKNQELLKTILNQQLSNDWKINLIKPDLEDVFINFSHDS